MNVTCNGCQYLNKKGKVKANSDLGPLTDLHFIIEEQIRSLKR